MVDRGIEVYVPEIADNELRRELIRAGKTTGLRRLDVVKVALRFLPISTAAMLMACRLWATARNEGLATAPKEALDGDAILAGQALTAGFAAHDFVIATSNVGPRGSPTWLTGRYTEDSSGRRDPSGRWRLPSG